MNSQSFLTLLTQNGHNGDTMCLGNIELEIKKGVAALVKCYENYISKEAVKKLDVATLKEAVKSKKTVWCKEGFITLKAGTLALNGQLMEPSDMRRVLTDSIVVL